MARYKAEKPLFVGIRHVNAGEQFESDDTPGRYWLPDDEEAEARVASSPPRRDPRHAALAKARDVRNANIAKRKAEAAGDEDIGTSDAPDKATGLKGRKGGKRTKDASSAKDRPPTPGKPVAEQQTDGEEPTRD